MTMQFDFSKPRDHGVFEAGLLPDSEKEALCRALLEEFDMDIRRIREPDGEMIVPCKLPDKGHTNQDSEPTGGLNYKKLTFKCLGCGSSGGLLWFIAEMRGESATDARKWLNGKAGIGQVMDLSDLLRYFDALYDTSKGRVAPIPRYDRKVLKPWEAIHPYLTEIRHIPEENIVRFNLGYAEAMRVAVGSDKATGKTIFKESERITIPHFWEGHLVGWQSRRLVDDGTPKFVSSPDFPKDQTIYNYDPKARFAVVVEAMLSTVRHDHQCHIEGTFGANVTKRQIALLQRHDTIVLFMDNDDAGWKAVDGTWHHGWGCPHGLKKPPEGWKRRGCEPVAAGLGPELSKTSNVFVAENPYAADAADMDDDLFMDCVDRAVPYAVWSRPKTLIPLAA